MPLNLRQFGRVLLPSHRPQRGFQRRRRRLLIRLLIVVPLCFLILSFTLPYDNVLGLLVRFWISQARTSLAFSGGRQDDWLREAPHFKTDLAGDVAVIIKTGYGTIDRVPAQLDAIGLSGEENLLVVADFATELERDGGDGMDGESKVVKVPVHDAIRLMLESGQVSKDATRIRKYESLQTAITSGDKEEAMRVGREVGWELDAMKFIPGLEKLYEKYPDKKWYIMIDDDTLLVKPSLQLLLDHLDPDTPQYIGNAVGDFRKRFAHGGSAYFISGAAMKRLFVNSRDVVHSVYQESLTETWGDRLIATALIRVGVYLDERYCHYFNGESPLETRIREDRFCSPLVSFHKLNTPDIMTKAGDVFRERTGVLTWRDVWGIYDQTDLDNHDSIGGREGRDHVGSQANGLGKTFETNTAIHCRDRCKRDSSACLAWSWQEDDGTCHLIPWFVVGGRADGTWSGLNINSIDKLMDSCEQYDPWGF